MNKLIERNRRLTDRESIMILRMLTRRFLIAGVSAAMAMAFMFVATSPASAACKNRGTLDVRYCDDNGDL